MLELNVSRLSNVVTFQVDRPSLEKAKAEVEKLRKQMAAVKDIELRVKTHKQSTSKEGANKRGNSSRLTQSFHFFMFEPIFSPVNALNQPI